MPLISILSYSLVLVPNISLDSQCIFQKTKTDAKLKLLHILPGKKNGKKYKILKQNNKNWKTKTCEAGLSHIRGTRHNAPIASTKSTVTPFYWKKIT